MLRLDALGRRAAGAASAAKKVIPARQTGLIFHPDQRFARPVPS